MSTLSNPPAEVGERLRRGLAALPLTQTNALGTTTTTYNLDHQVTSIEDADGRVRDFEYDNDQRLTAESWIRPCAHLSAKYRMQSDHCRS